VGGAPRPRRARARIASVTAVGILIMRVGAGLGRRMLPALFVLACAAPAADAAAAARRPRPATRNDAPQPTPGAAAGLSQILICMLQEQRGDFAGASAALHHAYLIDPHSPTLLRSLSRASLHAGDVESAVRYASDGIPLDPHDARLRCLRASIYQALG